MNVKTKYKIGDILYCIEGKRIEPMRVFAIRCDGTEWDGSENEQDEYSVAYGLRSVRLPELKEIFWVEEPEIEKDYYKSVSELLDALVDELESIG